MVAYGRLRQPCGRRDGGTGWFPEGGLAGSQGIHLASWCQQPTHQDFGFSPASRAGLWKLAWRCSWGYACWPTGECCACPGLLHGACASPSGECAGPATGNGSSRSRLSDDPLSSAEAAECWSGQDGAGGYAAKCCQNGLPVRAPGQELVLGPLRMRRFFPGTLPSVPLSCTKCTKLSLCVCSRIQGWVSLPCTRLYSCHSSSSGPFSCPRARACSGPLCSYRFGAPQDPLHSPEAIVTFSSAGFALANCAAGLCLYEHSVRFLGAVSDSALLCLGYLYEGCYPACRPGTPAAASAIAVSVGLARLPQYQVPLPHSLALCCTLELSLPPLVLQVASCPTSDSVLALPVHPRVAADDFLLPGTMHLQCALRTGLLLYFLSVMHCLARALKLRKGSPCYNKTLRHARSSFRGASVWLALGAAACFVDGAASVRCPDMPPPAHPQLAESAVHSAPPPSARRAVGSDAPAWLDPTFRATSGARNLRVQAQVFRYQAPTVDAYEWVRPHLGVPYLCKLFHDEVFYPRDRCRVLPVHPQPQVGFVALIEAPFWLTDQLFAPVLFEIHAVVVVRFCDYLVGRVTVEDLRGRVGDHWIPGGRFFVADAAEPIQEDAVVHVPPGSLIRLLPQAAPLPPRVPLQVKLQDPQRWGAGRIWSLARTAARLYWPRWTVGCVDVHRCV